MNTPEVRQIIGSQPDLGSNVSNASFKFNTVTGAETGVTKIDMAQFIRGREFLITAKTITNGTAPGASKTLQVYSYWSDDELDPTAGATLTTLANRKTSHSAVTLGNNANETLQWNISGATPIRMQARFLYVSFNLTALAANADVTGQINLVGIPTTATNL